MFTFNKIRKIKDIFGWLYVETPKIDRSNRYFLYISKLSLPFFQIVLRQRGLIYVLYTSPHVFMLVCTVRLSSNQCYQRFRFHSGRSGNRNLGSEQWCMWFVITRWCTRDQWSGQHLVYPYHHSQLGWAKIPRHMHMTCMVVEIYTVYIICFTKF